MHYSNRSKSVNINQCVITFCLFTVIFYIFFYRNGRWSRSCRNALKWNQRRKKPETWPTPAKIIGYIIFRSDQSLVNKACVEPKDGGMYKFHNSSLYYLDYIYGSRASLLYILFPFYITNQYVFSDYNFIVIFLL